MNESMNADCYAVVEMKLLMSHARMERSFVSRGLNGSRVQLVVIIGVLARLASQCRARNPLGHR